MLYYILIFLDYKSSLMSYSGFDRKSNTPALVEQSSEGSTESKYFPYYSLLLIRQSILFFYLEEYSEPSFEFGVLGKGIPPNPLFKLHAPFVKRNIQTRNDNHLPAFKKMTPGVGSSVQVKTAAIEGWPLEKNQDLKEVDDPIPSQFHTERRHLSKELFACQSKINNKFRRFFYRNDKSLWVRK